MQVVQNTPQALTHNFFTLPYTGKNENSVFPCSVLTNLAQITTGWGKIYYKKMAWIAKQATEKGFHEITNMNICRIKSGPPHNKQDSDNK